MTVRIAIDVMSGDIGPLATIPGAFKALESLPKGSVELIFVGQSDGIKAALPYQDSAVRIVHAKDAIRMDELPARALRQGKESSMWKAIELVAQGQADVCVSSGNTGALMAIARHLLRSLPGIKRPAICAQFPSKTTPTYLLDLGANVSSDAQQLVEFAKMGAALAQSVSGKILPTIALLNVGTEDTKGHPEIQKAAQAIQDEGLNYAGFVEGTDLFDGHYDVIVADGFSGNIALKASEGMANFALYKTQELFSKSWLFKCLVWFLKPIMKKHLLQISPAQHNGASLLGLNGLVVKSHGNANDLAFKQAILLAYTGAEQGVIKKLERAFLDN